MINVEDLVSAYVALRGERDTLKNEYEAKDLELKTQQEQLKQQLLVACNEVKADSIKTSAGTVIKKLNERFYCTDWDNFRRFVYEHNVLELFERRIHQGNFKEFLLKTGEDGLPPGVNVMREYDIAVRKSNNS